VGGHCIGVDPYYLTTKAEQLGYQPQVILAGRRINNSMGQFIAQKLVKMLIHEGTPVKGARVGVLGLTFKENVSDLRNSKVPDIVNELKAFGIEPIVHDPMGSPEEARHEYGLTLTRLEEFVGLDALVLAVGHKAYLEQPVTKLLGMVKDRGVLIDVKSALAPSCAERGIRYWSL
jgi:UDP-N-acetyl-D-galactosamine dehydrogenase